MDGATGAAADGGDGGAGGNGSASTKAGMDALVTAWADELETTPIKPAPSLLTTSPFRCKTSDRFNWGEPSRAAGWPASCCR